MGWRGQPHLQAASTTEKELEPILQEAGWTQGRSGLEENLVPTGIQYRIVQPLVSRYTD